MNQFKTIPQELKELPHWVCWRLEKRKNKEGIEKDTKIPINPLTGKEAKTNDPQTWTNFDTALEASNRFNGIGFVFTADFPFCGIDLDDCRTPETGELTSEAQETINQFSSYTELSQSGKGVHIIVKAKLNGGGRKRNKREIYDNKRFFVMTGNHLEGTPKTIEERQEPAVNFWESLAPVHKTPVKPTPSPLCGNLQDSEVVEKAKKAKNGAKFDSLWNGDFSGYGSQSEADLALCSLLAFYTQDKAQIDRIFRGSDLYREEKWGRADYREDTLQKALTGLTDTYNPIPIVKQEHKTEEGQKVILSVDYDPRFLANKFLEGKHFHYISEDFYFFNGKCYEVLDIEEIKSLVSYFLDGFLVAKSTKNIIPFRKTRNAIADIVSQVIALSYSKAMIPSFIGKDCTKLLCLNNGILDVETMELSPHTHDFLTTNLLNFDFEPKAKCKKWEAFLETQCPEGQYLLQEWFGLNLIPDTSYQKIFFLVGLPRTGKGTVLKVFEKLIGEKNYVSSTFSSLENDFGLSHFIGKLSAIFPDAHFSQTGRKDPVAVLETIKSISGEDTVPINRKGKDILSKRLKTRLTFAVNEIPRLPDRSNALQSRILGVIFDTSVPIESQDTKLFSRLEQELSGILNWALIGLQRLEEKGFSEMDSELKNSFQKAGNPMSVWIEECCDVGDGLKANCTELYNNWRKWCEENGHHSGSSMSFSLGLRSLIKLSRSRTLKKWHYNGIELKITI